MTQDTQDSTQDATQDAVPVTTPVTTPAAHRPRAGAAPRTVVPRPTAATSGTDSVTDAGVEPVPELTVLAGQARELADAEAAGHRAAGLRSLEQALREETDLGRWADCDLFAVLDVDGASPPPVERRSLLRSGSLRTILVFAPVLVTWVGLLFAGKAYAQMTAAGEGVDGQSFLQLWLDGFGGRTAMSLDRVAELAVVLITAAIAVSVATDRRQRADEQAALEAGQDHRQRLRAFVARTTLALAPHRSNAAEQLGAHFERGLTELGRLVAETIRLHADTSALVATVRESSSTAITAAQAAQDGGSQVGAAATALTSAVTTAMAQHSELIAADRAQHTATLTESTSTLVQVMSEVKDGTASAMREGLQGRDRVLSAVEGVTASIETLSTQTRAAMSELTASAESMTRHSADFGEKVTGHVAALSTSAEESVKTMHATVVESVQTVTRMTGEAFSEHVAASAERAAATMETLRRDVERTSSAAERALATASSTLAETTAAQTRRVEHDAKLQSLLQTQNEVLVSWRGVEDRLDAAAHDMRSVPRWLETIQHEHADATGRALATMGATLRDEVVENVRETLAMGQEDHVRQVNRAYRDASRQLQEELTHSLHGALDQLPQRVVAQHQAQHQAIHQPVHQAPPAGGRQRPPAVAERRPEPAERPARQVERPLERHVERRPERHVEDRRPVREPVRGPVREPVRTREPVREAPRETTRENDVEEAFVALPPRTLSSLVARRYARADS